MGFLFGDSRQLYIRKMFQGWVHSRACSEGHYLRKKDGRCVWAVLTQWYGTHAVHIEILVSMLNLYHQILAEK